jgi:hypothetical protein
MHPGGIHEPAEVVDELAADLLEQVRDGQRKGLPGGLGGERFGHEASFD